MILNTLMKVVQLWQIFTFSLTLPAAEGQANKNPQHLLLSLASQFIFATTSHHYFALLSIAPAYIVVSSPVPARMPGSKNDPLFLPVFGPVWLLRRCPALLIINQGTVRYSSVVMNSYNTDKILHISVCGWQVFTLNKEARSLLIILVTVQVMRLFHKLSVMFSLLSPVNLAIHCSIQSFVELNLLLWGFKVRRPVWSWIEWIPDR